MADLILYILNLDFEMIKLVDSYESFIWTDRYNEFGDFEIFLSANDDVRNYAKQGYYLWSSESEHLMIIEGLEIKSDTVNGNKLIITGRSLESILDRRIVWNQTNFNGKLQNGIKKLITDAFISPSIGDRKISNFIFEDSTDPLVTKPNMDAQYTGDNLYDVVRELCVTNNLGYKITLNHNNQFVFKLYSGVDRSYGQETNPYVVFSPLFENIINSDYLENSNTLKNVTLVAGEGEGVDRKTTIVGGGKGLNRRELYTDARDISSKTEDDVQLTPAQYNQKLIQRGTEKLGENKAIKTFDGQVDTTIIYKYKEDFFIGDVVQTVNDYGQDYQARISEIIFSYNTSGYLVYPSFTIIDDN